MIKDVDVKIYEGTVVESKLIHQDILQINYNMPPPE